MTETQPKFRWYNGYKMFSLICAIVGFVGAVALLIVAMVLGSAADMADPVAIPLMSTLASLVAQCTLVYMVGSVLLLLSYISLLKERHVMLMLYVQNLAFPLCCLALWPILRNFFAEFFNHVSLISGQPVLRDVLPLLQGILPVIVIVLAIAMAILCTVNTIYFKKQLQRAQ